MGNRIAKIPVSFTLLEHMLPPGTVIQGFKQNDYYHSIEVIVEHPSFDELMDGESIPTKMLMAHKTFCELGNHSYVSKVNYAS